MILLMLSRQHGLLPPSIAGRVRFNTTAMHAYGHMWKCQLIYNPRLCKGLGLTDGEGSERVWSRLTKLIPIVRASSVCCLTSDIFSQLTMFFSTLTRLLEGCGLLIDSCLSLLLSHWMIWATGSSGDIQIPIYSKRG